MKTIFILILFIFIAFNVSFGQKKATVSGIILDEKSGEPLSGANVILLGTKLGSASDLNGFYQITGITTGEYTICASMVGYIQIQQKIVLLPGEVAKLDLVLKDTLVSVPEVVITAERLVEGASVSDVAMTPRMLESRDGLMEDPMKVLQTLPGVVSMNDPFAVGQLYIRGGAPEENLFLLDWARVYFPWYMGGVKSIFNSQIVERIELLTGGFPPKYGNALSSVLSVTTREGNKEKYSGGFSLGVMTSQGLMEGPLSSKSSFLLTFRRTYLDLLMGESEDYPIPSFYDGNLKFSYELSPVHSLTLTGFASYEGQDFYTADPDPGLPTCLKMNDYVNTQSLELNSIFSRKIYSKMVLMRSFISSDIIGGSIYDVDSGVEVIGLREDLTCKPDPRHEIKTGFEFNRMNTYIHNWMPMDPSDSYTTFDSTGIPMDYYDHSTIYGTAGVYAQDSYNILKPLTFTGGLRCDYHFWSDQTDWSPRLSGRYDLNDKTALRVAWGEYYMFKDLMFLQEDRSLESDHATHYILGINQIFNRSFSGWLEIYLKDYDHIITVDSSGAFSDDGSGSAKGVELFLQKKLGALTGWVTYSLSLAKRREYFDTQEGYFDYDQRNISSLVLEYRTPRPQGFIPDIIGLNFRYTSGRPYTPVVSAYQDTSGNWILEKGGTNSERFDPFHALSLRFEWEFSVLRGASGEVYLEIWNLYDHKNQMGVDYRYGSDYPPDNVQERFYYSTPFLAGGGIGLKF